MYWCVIACQWCCVQHCWSRLFFWIARILWRIGHFFAWKIFRKSQGIVICWSNYNVIIRLVLSYSKSRSSKVVDYFVIKCWPVPVLTATAVSPHSCLPFYQTSSKGLALLAGFSSSLRLLWGLSSAHLKNNNKCSKTHLTVSDTILVLFLPIYWVILDRSKQCGVKSERFSFWSGPDKQTCCSETTISVRFFRSWGFKKKKPFPASGACSETPSCPVTVGRWVKKEKYKLFRLCSTCSLWHQRQTVPRPLCSIRKRR